MIYPNLVKTGTVGSTAINADVSAGLGSAVAIKVTLSADYTLANPRPVGFPFKPAFTGSEVGAAGAGLDYPGRVLASGSTIAFLKSEADALVAAGAGSYA